MTTYAINLKGAASTRFTNYAFDSFCRGPDGKYYGIKADGLFLLEGADDAGDPIAASAGLGKHHFGSMALKAMPYAYAAGASSEVMEFVVATPKETYAYPARSCSDEMGVHRFDLGKGLSENYYDLAIRNTDGGSFTLDSLEAIEIKSKRRIQS